ncbi:hypothetical protein [Paenibacillus sp. SAFN-117]|uniref:hypothetical protein n=1 Tax=Paenibacillus sp. SAFN-117 TaxID=3436860 RepID=UPI003F7E25CC
MRKWFVLFTVLAILLVGCSSRPPMPSLTADNIKIPVVLGTYAWKNVVADAPGPNYLVKDTESVTVSPGTEVTIKFSGKPDRMILSRWEGQESREEVELESNKFTLPEEKGEYIYSIRAEWGKNKSGLYAFIVKVE